MKNSAAQVQSSTDYQGSIRLRTRLANVWVQLQRGWELAEQRRKLALLDEQALHDLGLSRADVQRECARPFWDDPLSRPLSARAANPPVSGSLLS